MENSLQKNAFIGYEADAWFERNKEYLENYSAKDDKVTNLIREYNLNPKSVLEIGCAAGYRLDGIKSFFNDCDVFGIEPSKRAIEYGRKHFERVNFNEGTADDLGKYANASKDVVIVGFVFYVIDRNIVFKVVSEIDRVLKNGGILIIVDFFSESPIKNEYQHIKNFNAYSFKQNYDEIFTSSKLYYLLDKSTLNHSTKVLDATEDYFNKYSIAMLKKDINASYK